MLGKSLWRRQIVFTSSTGRVFIESGEGLRDASAQSGKIQLSTGLSDFRC